MSDRELKELDAWIDTFVFGNHHHAFVSAPGKAYSIKVLCGKCNRFPGALVHQNSQFNYTTDLAATMRVLEKCLQHPKQPQITLISADGGFGVISGHDTFAETLPLAICQFAKELFSIPKGQ